MQRFPSLGLLCSQDYEVEPLNPFFLLEMHDSVSYRTLRDNDTKGLFKQYALCTEQIKHLHKGMSGFTLLEALREEADVRGENQLLCVPQGIEGKGVSLTLTTKIS